MLHLQNPVEIPSGGGASAGAGAGVSAGAGAGSAALGASTRVVLQKGRIVHVDESKMDDSAAPSAPRYGLPLPAYLCLS